MSEEIFKLSCSPVLTGEKGKAVQAVIQISPPIIASSGIAGIERLALGPKDEHSVNAAVQMIVSLPKEIEDHYKYPEAHGLNAGGLGPAIVPRGTPKASTTLLVKIENGTPENIARNQRLATGLNAQAKGDIKTVAELIFTRDPKALPQNSENK